MENSLNKNDQVDLYKLFLKTNDLFNNFLASTYRLILFTLKFWIIFIILIIAGIVAGYFANKNDYLPKESDIQIRVNYNLGKYVYNEIDLINRKITNVDSIFLKKNDLWKNGKTLVMGVEIEPLVSFQELIEDYGISNRTFETLLDNYSFEGTNSASKNFKYEFRYHLLNIKLSHHADSNTVKNLISAINDNPLLQDFKETGILNINDRINSNKEMIEQINSLISSYIRSENIDKISQSVVLDKDVSGLIEKKRAIQAQLEEFRSVKAVSDNIVVMINEPFLVNKQTSILDNKMILYPLLLIILFYLISFFIKLLLKAKTLHYSKFQQKQ